MAEERQQWGSRLGFILAASGSAIGLGNIVFFSANAYKYGAGAFYVPYLVALLVVGIPVMVLEFGLGRVKAGSFPASLGRVGGKVGEFAGWWAIFNAFTITMYYVTILGWVAGMWWHALIGGLWESSVAVPEFGMAQGDLPNPYSTFFNMLSNWANVIAVLVVWALNIAIVINGTKSIEKGVKVLMPLMWVFMIGLVFVGMGQDGGAHGAYLLFTPNFDVIGDVEVWQGAFSQMFFTLSLGFGIMTAYASYLPKNSDHVANGMVVAGLNCLFEMVAGLAVFSLLFAFALTPKASTISMMFFIVPQGISQLGTATQIVGVLFFTLLLIAGLSSSISLLEAAVSAVLDKFRFPRKMVVLALAGVGIVGSISFAMPTVINSSLSDDGTLGLTLLDIVDHYAFGYGLMFVGLVECLIIGWMLPVEKLRETINQNAAIKLGAWFDWMVKIIIPAVIIFLLGYSILSEIQGGALYGGTFSYDESKWEIIPVFCAVGWIAVTFGGAAILTIMKATVDRAPGEEA